MKNIEIIWVIIKFAAIIGFIACLFAGKKAHEAHNEEIYSNKKFTEATVTDYRQLYRSGLEVKYFYVVNGEKFEDYNEPAEIPVPVEEMMGKKYAVMYSSRKPGYHILILTKKDSIKYGLKYSSR